MQTASRSQPASPTRSSVVDLIRLAQAQACIESACRSLALGLKQRRAHPSSDYARWYARADASLCFAGALLEALRVRRCRILGTGRFALPRS